MGPRKHPHNAFFLHALSSICGSRNSLWPPTFCECKFHGLLRVSPIFSLKKWNVQPEVQLLVWKPDLRYDLLVLCPKLGQVWGQAWEPIEVIWLLLRARYQLKFLEASVRKPPAPGLSLLAWLYRNLPLYLGPQWWTEQTRPLPALVAMELPAQGSPLSLSPFAVCSHPPPLLKSSLSRHLLLKAQPLQPTVTDLLS